MDTQASQTLAQWGLGAVIALTMAGALVKTLFRMLAENRALRRELIQRHYDWEERFFLGLCDCINRNTTALEDMEKSLETVQRILEETVDEQREI